MPHEQFHSVVVFTSNAELKTKMPENVGYLSDMLSYIKSFDNEVIDNQAKVNMLDLVETIKLDQGRKTNKRHVKYLESRNSG